MMTMTPRATGRVHILKYREGGEVTQELEFDNVVLHRGIRDMICSWCSTAWPEVFRMAEYLHMGTGTTEPKGTDSSLESRSQTLAPKRHMTEAGNTGANHGSYSQGLNYQTDEYWYQLRLRFAYTMGQAAGVWTELGLADQNYQYPLTRALIRDTDGSPMALTVLSDEYLVVTYSLRVYLNGFNTGVMELDGVEHEFRLQNGLSPSSSILFHGTRPYLNITPRQSNLTTSGGRLFAGSSPTVYGSGSAGVTYSRSTSFNSDTLVLSNTLTFPPTDANRSIVSLTYTGPHEVIFVPTIVKKRDYRVVLTMAIAFEVWAESVSGVAFTATMTSLSFTWDPYPQATEYRLRLMRGAEVVEDRVVAGTQATFTDLIDWTDHRFIIQAITPTMKSGRFGITARTLGS